MIRNLAGVSKLAAASLVSSFVLSGCSAGTSSQPASTAPAPVVVTPTAAPSAIKHVVVIFGENISFDHYFGTYPNALNLPGETKFTPATGTPTTANNYVSNPGLLTNNPNLSVANVAGSVIIGSNPFRLAPAQALTADQDHGYTDEQKAFDGGKMDLFPLSVGTADSATQGTNTGAPVLATTKALTMATTTATRRRRCGTMRSTMR
jgi:phospholipase C